MSAFAWMLDRSILFSFDRSGYQRHRERFDARDLDRSMRGKACLVTGANSGLGFEVARGLATRGAVVHLLCRDPERGAEARAAIAARAEDAEVHLDVIDMSSLVSVRGFADAFTPPRVDVLVHNAGSLPLT